MGALDALEPMGDIIKLKFDQNWIYRKIALSVARGYKPHFDWMTAVIDDLGLTEAECLRVRETLYMFTILGLSYRFFLDSSTVDRNALCFSGYDGLQETQYMLYAQSVIQEDKVYPYIFENDEVCVDTSAYRFDSGTPMLQRYDTMLARWNAVPNRTKPTLEEILTIIAP